MVKILETLERVMIVVGFLTLLPASLAHIIFTKKGEANELSSPEWLSGRSLGLFRVAIERGRGGQ